MSNDEQLLNPEPAAATESGDMASVPKTYSEPVPSAEAPAPQENYATELITTGPLSERVRVYDIKDIEKLQEVSTPQGDDRSKIYESSLRDVRKDQRILGTVVAVHESEIMVDVGFKSEGMVSRDEFAEGELPKIGDQIEVFVDVLEDENGQMILSKRKADFMRIWERIREVHNSGEIIEGHILSRIKGGMVVDVMGIDAFLPGSQIDIRPVTDFDSYVGKTLEFKIVKLNELRKNIVLSRKEILEESMKEKRNDLLSRIKVGDILTGRVKNITDFGVFIDLGGLDGLLHITDISWGRINHPREVVTIDQELTVKVIDYNQEKQRVSLGLKQLTPHPWEGIEQKYPVDSVVKGKVVNITNYGVFVELEKGVEGLIHISEISWTQHIKHPSEVFSMGDQIEAKVLGIDSTERKISLGFKQLEPDPWDTLGQNYSVGTVVKGVIKNLTPYGAYVELQEGIDGFIHVSDMSWTKKLRHPREMLRKDQEIEVKILEISKENRKISLGLKQLVEDPWPMIETLFSPNSLIEGEVARITEKFIVVNLEHDLEGIVPLGQMPKKDRKDLSKAVTVGEKMQLMVLDVNKHDKKIILSRELAIPRKPKTEVEAYMYQQTEATDKIEIPTELIAKIAESEEQAAPPAPIVETSPAEEPVKKSRTRAKKEAKPTEDGEPVSETETTTRKKTIRKVAKAETTEITPATSEEAAGKKKTRTGSKTPKKSKSTESAPSDTDKTGSTEVPEE